MVNNKQKKTLRRWSWISEGEAGEFMNEAKASVCYNINMTSPGQSPLDKMHEFTPSDVVKICNLP